MSHDIQSFPAKVVARQGISIARAALTSSHGAGSAQKPAGLAIDGVLSSLPKTIKAVYRVVGESGQNTGSLAVEAVNQAGDTVLNVIDLKKLSVGHLEEIAQLAVDADLYAFQSRKGANELSALIRQSDKQPCVVVGRDGYHRVDYGGQVNEFFVWRNQLHVFDGNAPSLALRIISGLATFPPPSGNLQDWKSEVGVHVVRNPYMLIAVLAGFTGLLHHAFDLPKLVLMFVGPSSQGKTTLLRAGQSVVTSAKDIETFAGTTKGVEGKLREHSDSPAFMDELRQADVPADLVKLVFDLESGASRKVSSASQQVVQRGPLRVALVAANESTLPEITSGIQVKINEGIGARLIEVHIQAPHGAFHMLPANMTAKQFAEHMKLVTSRLHGTAWDVWVTSIAKNALKVRNWLAENLAQVEEELSQGLQVNNPVTARLVRGMAAWACTGLLAVRFKLLETDRKVIIAAVRLVLEEHLKRNLHGSHSVAEQVVGAVRACIDQNGSKFPPLAQFHSPDHSGIYGYRVGHGEDAEFLFLPSVFEKLFGQKYGVDATARALKAAGYLKCAKDAGYQYQKRVPDLGGGSERKRFYAVVGRIRFD
jgi:hypothetical protein